MNGVLCFKDECEGYGLEPLYVDRLFPWCPPAEGLGNCGAGTGCKRLPTFVMCFTLKQNPEGLL